MINKQYSYHRPVGDGGLAYTTMYTLNKMMMLVLWNVSNHFFIPNIT